MTLNPLVRASLAPGALLLGGLLLVSGCGGGGSGTSIPTSTPIPGATTTPTPLPGTVFSDEFNSGQLSSNMWAPLDGSNSLQRTQFGNTPDFKTDNDGTQYMRVKLDTYLQGADSNRQFFGTEVAAKQLISPPVAGQSIDFQARVRVSNPQQLGLVGAFFLFGGYGNFGGSPLYSFDEIDHELLTNSFNASPSTTWTNIYNNFRVPQPGFPNGDSYVNNTTRVNGLSERTIANYNLGAWNVYEMVWQPTQVEWFINGQSIRIAKAGSDPIPNHPIGVRFNLWAPTAPPIGWADAYSSTLQPATNAGANQTYSVDVDWVHVRSLGSGTTSPAKRTAALTLVPATSAELHQSGAGYQTGRGR